MRTPTEWRANPRCRTANAGRKGASRCERSAIWLSSLSARKTTRRTNPRGKSRPIRLRKPRPMRRIPRTNLRPTLPLSAVSVLPGRFRSQFQALARRRVASQETWQSTTHIAGEVEALLDPRDQRQRARLVFVAPHLDHDLVLARVELAAPRCLAHAPAVSAPGNRSPTRSSTFASVAS